MLFVRCDLFFLINSINKNIQAFDGMTDWFYLSVDVYNDDDDWMKTQIFNTTSVSTQ